MTDRAVHRVVQEALTNAAKHASGAAVDVQVVRDNDTVTTTVRNVRPTGPSSGLASGRAGLVGLGERVRLGGGTLSHGPSSELIRADRDEVRHGGCQRLGTRFTHLE